jgi:hypothetical protein
MQSAVYHLTTRRPHEDDAMRLTAADHGVYERGYYRALVAALRAMEHVLVRRALWLRERRRNARQAALERRRLEDVASAGVGAEIRPVADHAGEGRGQTADCVHWKTQTIVLLRDFIPADDGEHAGARVDPNVPIDPSEHRTVRHPLTIHPTIEGAQSHDRAEPIAKCLSENPAASEPHPGGELAHRPAVRESRKPRQKQNRKS